MPFTERQAQILELAARGHSDKEIARELGLSVHTIRTHLQRLYTTEGFSNRAAAVGAWVALQAGDAPPSKPLSGLHRHVPIWRAGIALGVVAALALSVPLARAVVEMAPSSGHRLAASSSGVASPPPSPSSQVSLQAATPQASPQKTTPTPGATMLPLRTTVPLQVMSATAELTTMRVTSRLVRDGAAQGFVSSADGSARDAGCHLGSLASPPPAEVLTYWSGVNDAQVNSLIMGDPVQRTAVLGPYHYLGGAWAVAPSGVAYLALELA